MNATTKQNVDSMYSLGDFLAPTEARSLAAKLPTKAVVLLATATTAIMLSANTVASQVGVNYLPNTGNNGTISASLQDYVDGSRGELSGHFEYLDIHGVVGFLDRHPEFRIFLSDSLSVINAISNNASLALDYWEDDEFEQLYLVIHLDDADYENVSKIEKELYDAWYLQANSHFTNRLVISFS